MLTCNYWDFIIGINTWQALLLISSSLSVHFYPVIYFVCGYLLAYIILHSKLLVCVLPSWEYTHLKYFIQGGKRIKSLLLFFQKTTFLRCLGVQKLMYGTFHVICILNFLLELEMKTRHCSLMENQSKQMVKEKGEMSWSFFLLIFLFIKSNFETLLILATGGYVLSYRLSEVCILLPFSCLFQSS